MSADKRLKGYIDRVLRLKEEQDTLGDDIREVYAEAKGEGYDKTVMGKLVAHLRKVAKSGADAVDEAESIFETYLSAYHRASGTPVATHTHEEEFDPLTGEFVDDNEASGSSPAAPASLATREAEESVVSNHSRPAALAVSGGEPSIPSPDAGGVKMGGSSHPGRSDETSAYCNAQSGRATIPHSEKATVATQGEATEPTSDDGDPTGTYAGEDRAAANAGGTDVARSATRAGLADPTSNTGEGAANIALPDKPKHRLRPNCLDRSNCKSGSVDHCWSCKKAMAEKSEVAA